jgi:hypothetical protein
MKIALEQALILALLFSVLAGTQMVNLAKANPNFMKGHYCNISIQSPQNITYKIENIRLNFTAKTHWNIPPLYFYFYSLDGQDMQSSVKIEDVQIVSEENITDDTSISYIETTLRGQAELPLLTNGQHIIKVFAGYFINETIHHANIDPYSATANFIVYTGTASPSPSPSPPQQPTETPESKPGLFLPMETPYVIVAVIIVVVVATVLAVALRKRKKYTTTQTLTPPSPP